MVKDDQQWLSFVSHQKMLVNNTDIEGAKNMKYMKLLVQIGVLGMIAFLGNTVSHILPVKIPGSIISIMLLFVLLECKLLPVQWIEAGANVLIADLVLFFVPSAVAVITFEPLMKQQGMSFLLTIAVSTLGVMLFVGLLAESVLRYRERGNN